MSKSARTNAVKETPKVELKTKEESTEDTEENTKEEIGGDTEEYAEEEATEMHRGSHWSSVSMIENTG